MLKRSKLVSALPVIASLTFVVGCRPSSQSNLQPQQMPTPPANHAETPKTAVPELADIKPVVEAVSATVRHNPDFFPKGVALKSIVITSGVATLDFNGEFNRLANMGDSTESAAQKHLRAVLSGFPAIRMMRVTVLGKPFDSQTADWTTPIPVRQSDAEKDSVDKKSDGSTKPSDGIGNR